MVEFEGMQTEHTKCAAKHAQSTLDRRTPAHLRDRGLDCLSRRQFAPEADAAVVLTPRFRRAFAMFKWTTPCGHHQPGLATEH
jgi:hypothetical protein